MHRLALSLAIHNHQPVGNFDHVIAEAATSAYAPMIGALERHPAIRVALHYSGCLLDWLMPHRPDVIERLRTLVGRGQVEILTGAYYEPILPIIPDADKQGQIEKLTRTVAEQFGYAAEGLWLAERVWEPHLARPLGLAGVRYTILDDAHFYAVGMDDAQLLGYYVTEEDGIPLAIFPSLRRLRYMIPWASVEEVIAYLRTLAETDIRVEGREAPLDLALMADDGEKFGLWPTTYKHCWENGWVERFFDALEREPWIDLVHPAEYRRTRDAAGWVYLPTGTYDEMAEWALPAERAGQAAHLRKDLQAEGRAETLLLLRGGFWRHFLVKYPEVNTLHRLALRAGAKVWAMRRGADRSRALDELWAGECNCTYWHGVFGGAYLPHIRGAAFAHLIAAEALADRVGRRGQYASVTAQDLDGDGREEILMATDQTVLTVDPARGGAGIEWDDRTARRHLGKVFTRRPEVYHQNLRVGTSDAAGGGIAAIGLSAEEARRQGLGQILTYDRTRRTALRVHLLPLETTREQMERSEHTDIDGFSTGAYVPGFEVADRTARLRLLRSAAVRNMETEGEATLERCLDIEAGRRSLAHTIRLAWTGTGPLRIVVAEEWNLGVFGAPGDVWVSAAGERRSFHEPVDLPADNAVAVTEVYSGLTLSFSPSAPAAVWGAPLFTISNSEAGYERTYQGGMLVLRWAIAVAPGETWEQTTRCDVTTPQPVRAAPPASTA